MSERDPRASLSPAVGEVATTRRETVPHTPPDRPPAPVSGGRIPPRPMRYRPLRFHAKGGLGEIYIAEDLELRREVALKKITQTFAEDPDSRERFLFEAEITGGLEHPSIVPVYGLVEDADGTPCYAMRYIHGETLREAIRRYHAMPVGSERRKELRNLLSRFVAVCNAVAYAHNRGVLHRDLKPNNILLDKYGETLVVDWGLAKKVGSRQKAVGASEPGASASGDASTRIGKAIGTPGYMSPEQAAGHWDQVGPASDIFALGSTLLDLLAGPDSNPQSRPEEKDTVQYGQGTALPRFAGMPKPLEAVCRKAMAQDPKDRYSSALDLARDIENWLADEPVSSWREPWTVRARRWLGRHRTLVSSVCVAVFVAALSLGVATVLLAAANEREANERAKAQDNFRLADQAHRRELQERAKAEQNYQLARQAVDRFYTEVSQDVLLNQPGMEDLRKRLLSTARDYYERLVQQKSDDPGVKAEFGRAQWRLAFITHAVESHAKAIEHYAKAVGTFEELKRDHPDNADYDYGFAKSLNNLGFAQYEVAKLDDAEKALRQALDVFEKLAAKSPSRADYATGIASAYNNLALVYRSKREESKAEEVHNQALSIRSRLAKESPGVPEFQHDLASTLNNLGVLYRATRRPEKAEETYKLALAIREKLATLDPGFNKYQHDLANSHNNLGLFYRGQDRRDDAKEHLEKAQNIWETLTKEHPRVVEYRNGLATNSANVAALYLRMGNPQLAEKHFQRAIGVWEDLRRSHPSHAQFEVRLAVSYSNMGNFLKETKNADAALGWYAKAIEALKTAADQGEAGRQLRMAHWGRGEALTLLKRHEEAQTDFDRAIELSTGATRDMMRLQRAGSLARMGKHAQAVIEAEPVVAPADKSAKVAAGALYNGVCVYGLASDAAKKDTALPEAERNRLAESHARRALQLLAQAKSAGFFDRPSNHDYLSEDPDLASLRARADFKAFVAEVKAK